MMLLRMRWSPCRTQNPTANQMHYHNIRFWIFFFKVVYMDILTLKCECSLVGNSSWIRSFYLHCCYSSVFFQYLWRNKTNKTIFNLSCKPSHLTLRFPFLQKQGIKISEKFQFISENMRWNYQCWELLNSIPAGSRNLLHYECISKIFVLLRKIFLFQISWYGLLNTEIWILFGLNTVQWDKRWKIHKDFQRSSNFVGEMRSSYQWGYFESYSM